MLNMLGKVDKPVKERMICKDNLIARPTKEYETGWSSKSLKVPTQLAFGSSTRSCLICDMFNALAFLAKSFTRERGPKSNNAAANKLALHQKLTRLSK